MPIEIVGVIALVLGGMSLWRGPDFAFQAFLPSMLLGAAAALILPGIGSIQPGHLLLGFVSLSVFSDRTNVRRMCESLRFPRPGFWLVLTWTYGVLAAMFIPRLWAGQLLVNPIGASETAAFTQVPIAPTSGNLTQSIYFGADIICFLACSVYAGTQAGLRTIATAMVAYCAANIALAFIDLATFWTGTAYLLDPIRNAGYTIYTDTVVINMKRIIGSFTEASSFAGATIGAFAFALQLGLMGVAPRTCLSIALISLVLLLFSTSTTAYVALPFCLALIALTTIWNAMRARAAPPAVLVMVFLPLIGAGLLIVVLLDSSLLHAIRDFLDAIVFTKADTSSGIDRARFNVEGLQSFMDTGGVGAGIGSVRTSSFVTAVLSNLGIIGGLSYTFFLISALMGRGPKTLDPFSISVRAAARAACISLLVSASISGALIDLGLPFFVFAALACAEPDVWPRAFRPRVLSSQPLLMAGGTIAPEPWLLANGSQIAS